VHVAADASLCAPRPRLLTLLCCRRLEKQTDTLHSGVGSMNASAAKFRR
jgi:hypothetical protein